MQVSKMLLITIFLLMFSCVPNSKKTNIPHKKTQLIKTDTYELHKIQGAQHTLILYPGLGTDSDFTKEEFDVLSAASENEISVILMEFNKHLWIDNETTTLLVNEIESIFSDHNMVNQTVCIGGMSIGGNISLTVANQLCENSSDICPEAVFIIDSPIDLFTLYSNCLADLDNPIHSEQRLAESKWVVEYFESELNKNDSIVEKIGELSPFTLSLNKLNVPELKNSKLRFYTEPDAEWWLKNRQVDFEFINAFMIRNVVSFLQKKNWNQVELIETKNKGYRSNGDRHPHSWSIVNVDSLITWIKE